MGDGLRIVLTLMNADGELYEHVFPKADGEATITQLAGGSGSRFVPFHREASQTDVDKQLARFHCSKLRLVLEPFCDGVTIEPSHPDVTTSESDGRVVIPPSNPEEHSHHYVHLRPDDVIHFETRNLIIRYRLQDQQTPTKMASAILSAHEDVQVKSSDPRQPDGDALMADPSESETEDEDAGDLHKTATPIKDTSASSPPPTATREVKETPSHVRHEEDAPFSTARDQPVMSSNRGTPQREMPSSEIRLAGDATASDGATPSGKHVPRGLILKHQASSRIPSFSQDDFPSSPVLTKMMKKPEKTYGKSSGRSTPDRRADATQDAGDESLDMVQGQTTASSSLPAQATSDIEYPKGRAYEVAARSMSKKRKVALDLDEEAGAPLKARKLSQEDAIDNDEAKNATEAEQPDEEDKPADESDDDGPSQIEAGPRVSSGRLPRVARADESDDDNIVAKPWKDFAARPISSPEIVVRAQRASKSASKTPRGTPRTPDSTAPSSFPGKPPKIVVSNVANKYTPSSALGKFIKSQGSTIVDSVPSRRTNFLCMVKSEKKLLKTPKVLRSLALGKHVVTERWIDESKAAGELLNPSDFIHEEAAETAGIDRRNLFDGLVLYFTNGAVKSYGSENWQEMKELATEAGASSVESGTGAKGGKMTGRNSIIYIGVEDDPDATALIEDHSRVVYHKDLVKDAVVSGELGLDDGKYKLVAGAKKKKGRR